MAEISKWKTLQLKIWHQLLGERTFGLCWFLASLGTSAIQMTILKSVWLEERSAFFVTLIMGVWLLGTLLGQWLCRESIGQQNIFLGELVVGIAFLFIWIEKQYVGQSSVPLALHILLLFVIALLEGASSSCWLQGARQTFSVKLNVMQGVMIIGARAGLAMSWLLPLHYLRSIVLYCFIPLLLFDRLSFRKVAESESLHLGSNSPHICLRQRSQTARLYSYMSIIGVGVMAVIGSLWAALLTPSAALAVASHHQEVLLWLLGGQILAWCFYLLLRHYFPEFDFIALNKMWKGKEPYIIVRGYILGALVSLMLMSVGLLDQTLPQAQIPWIGALFLGLYSLGWGSWLHLRGFLRRVGGYLKEQEEQWKKYMILLERGVLLCLLPIAGWLRDCFGPTALLEGVSGILLLFFLGGLLFVIFLRYRRIHDSPLLFQ